MEFEHFKKTLKKFRSDKNYSQEKLAEILEVDPTTISHLENGNRAPSVEFLIAFSNYSHISIDSMLMEYTEQGLKNELNKQNLKMSKLSPQDRVLVINVMEQLIDRLLKDNK